MPSVCDQLTHRHQLWQGLCCYFCFVLYLHHLRSYPPPCFIYKFISFLLSTAYFVDFPALLTLFGFSTFLSCVLFSNFISFYLYFRYLACCLCLYLLSSISFSFPRSSTFVLFHPFSTFSPLLPPQPLPAFLLYPLTQRSVW